LEVNKHSSVLGPYIQACLDDAKLKSSDLNGVSVSSGPGSYTGLRVGASIAKGLCYTLGIPMLAIDSLESIALFAAGQYEADIIVPMIDARRMEVYTAYFNHLGTRTTENRPQILEDQLFAPFLADQKRIVICGNGTPKARPLFEHLGIVCDDSIVHSSLHLLKPALAAYEHQIFADIYHFAPGYLKAPNITISKKSMI
jgi:tRNA threonylcarbamoyladenosine biosynthesis protein TsaB